MPENEGSSSLHPQQLHLPTGNERGAEAMISHGYVEAFKYIGGTIIIVR